ncbi:CPBP family intramembrane glutamic endopeptidase [Anaerocolumna jejuensis]|uniref:CPBP family intramembrane glutamic endopeptidase n=1 Tax=Anaerocolumna jejuensis TaxID=259063 RepID=UPI003F7CD070
MRNSNQYLKESNLFRQAKTSRVKYNIPLMIIAYFLLWLVGLGLGRLLASAVLNIFGSIGDISETAAVTLKRFVVCLTQIAFFFSWVKFVEKRPVRSLGFQARSPLKSYTFGFLAGLSAITAIILILLLTGAIKLNYYPIEYGYMVLNFGTAALSWMVQSASEEIAIRGWLIPSLEKKSSPIMAITITSVIFGILHLFSSGVTILSFTNLILSGIFFAGYAILNGNIWGVCGLHFAWNFALANIYGLPFSGFAVNGARIFKAQQAGPRLLTGGDFGPEGGLVTTIILLAGIAVLVLKWKKSGMEV